MRYLCEICGLSPAIDSMVSSMWIGRIDDAASVSGTCLSSTAVYAADQVADCAQSSRRTEEQPTTY